MFIAGREAMVKRHQRLYILRQPRTLSATLPVLGKRADPSVKREILVDTSALFFPFRLLLPTTIQITQYCFPVLALIDSGSEQNLRSMDLLKWFSISLGRSHFFPQLAWRVKLWLRSTSKLLNYISGNHYEINEVFVFESPHTQLILGYTWLKDHNPHINWELGRVERWSNKCLKYCLCCAVASQPSNNLQTEEIDLSAVLSVSHDLAPVFTNLI